MNAIKGLVIGMSILIVVLTTVIGYGLYQKATNPDFAFFTKPTAKTEEPAIPQPTSLAPAPVANAPLTNAQLVFGERLISGAAIVSSQVDGGRLLLTIASAGKVADHVVIIDIATGTTLGTIRLAK